MKLPFCFLKSQIVTTKKQVPETKYLFLKKKRQYYIFIVVKWIERKLTTSLQYVWYSPSISQYYSSFLHQFFYTDFRDYKQILLDGKCKSIFWLYSILSIWHTWYKYFVYFRNRKYGEIWTVILNCKFWNKSYWTFQ